MKRVGLLAAAGALIVGSALPAAAQQAPPPFTVTFNGEFRSVVGASNNTTDYKDTAPDGKGGSSFKDSFHDFSQRWRLWTNVTSGDKHAGAVWALEIGDIIWGTGGGSSNGDGNGSNGSIGSLSGGRSGNGAGGALGADGVNVETKNSYMWFDVPGVDNLRLTIGIQNVEFLTQPTEFFSDDAAAVKVDWKFDPVTVQLWYSRFGDNEAPRAPSVNARSNDAYTARVWIQATPDWRFSVEGMLWNQQCFSNQIAAPTTVATPVIGGPTVGTVVAGGRTGKCLKSSFGDTYWVGGTVSGKLPLGIGLDLGIVYGQRELPGALGASQVAFKESGFGVDGALTIPVTPVTVTVEGWYTTGDKNRAPSDTSFATSAGPFVKTQNANKACTTPGGCFTGNGAGANGQNNSALIKNSDRLPSPDDQGSWYTRPLIAEVFSGMQTIGGPPEGTSPNYANKGGTYGVGSSAMLAILPNLTVGAGVAYVGASDAEDLWGKHLFEVDGGVFYTLNANVTVQGVAGYIIPGTGDNAWGAAVRTRFRF